jgi:hypothetical protein
VATPARVARARQLPHPPPVLAHAGEPAWPVRRTGLSIGRIVRSKMQGPEQIKEAGGRLSAGGVLEDRARRLKVLTDGVVIGRGQADLDVDRRHVRAELPGVVASKRQGGCLGLKLVPLENWIPALNWAFLGFRLLARIR